MRISPDCVIPRPDLHHGLVLPQQVPAVLPVRAQPRLPPSAVLLFPAQLRTPVRRPLRTLDKRQGSQLSVTGGPHLKSYYRQVPCSGFCELIEKFRTQLILYTVPHSITCIKEYSFISVFVSKEGCLWIYLFVTLLLCMEIIR